MEYLLLQRIMKSPPIKEYITPGSTPVVAFGNPITARVATVGINPSSQEFVNRKGDLLTGEKRRLADFQSLGIKSYSEIDENIAQKILEESNSYFLRDESVYDWFRPLEKYVLEPTGTKYSDSSATHLDLVQWSTAPVWRRIREKSTQEILIKDDIRFLAEMMQKGDYEIVFLNGATVVKNLVKYGVVALTQDGHTPLGKAGHKSALWTGSVIGSKSICLGWNLNLQQEKTTESNKQDLRSWISERIKGL
jgi:hypothetical protein